MLISHPRDALVLAHERVCYLRVETAADHLRRASGTRRALAAALRRAATRLDPAPLAHRPA
jgi:hypothetical protein